MKNPAATSNPFVGLRPFRSVESKLFFGRSKEISVLRDLAVTLPVLVVYAPSGTGKSSLINAGLVPEIRKIPMMLDITIADPQLEPAIIVRDELAANGWTPGSETEGLSLAELLEYHYKQTDRRVILVLDQFEERIKRYGTLDTLYRDIAKLANTRSEAVTVIISIREDYLAGLDPLMRRVSGLLDAGYRVPPLSRAALTEAVNMPLEAVDAAVTVESGLIDEVLTDLEQQQSADPADPRIEPGYFQIVWHRLWEVDVQEAGGRLTHKTYEAEGRAGRILKSFVTRILANMLPFEAAVLQASLRYLVLPTGAKVALTIDDLVGLLRPNDLSIGFDRLLFPSAFYPSGYLSGGPLPGGPDVAEPEPDYTARIISIIEVVFNELTQANAPLFRRISRGTREEFELVHDLLGNIFNEWRKEYEVELNGALNEFRSGGELTPWTGANAAARSQFMAEVAREANAGEWDTISDGAASDKLTKTLASFETSSVLNAAEGQRVREAINVLEKELVPAAFEYPNRDVRRVLQRHAWQLVMRDRARPYQMAAGSNRPYVGGFIAIVLAAGSSAALAAWLSGLLSFLPIIYYRELTLGAAAAAIGVVYLLIYSDSISSDRGWIKWEGLKEALWPIYNRRNLPRRPPPAHKEPSIQKVMLQVGYGLFSWPVMFCFFTALCYSGAAVFGVIGWSPTAGFNFVGLGAGALMVTIYLSLTDFL